MKKCEPLPRADMTNIFTCLDVYDIDFDSSKEILIGNSTEVGLLILKLKQSFEFNFISGHSSVQIQKRERLVSDRH